MFHLVKVLNLFGGGEVKTINRALGAPLMETRCRLVVNEWGNDARVNADAIRILGFLPDDAVCLILL